MTSYFRKYATSAYIPDFTKAQQSEETGYVSPIAEPPREDTPTRALPHPESSQAVVSGSKSVMKPSNQESQPELDREYAIPMYPGVAQELNDSIKDNSELFSYWRSGPAPTWNPWHPGYTRKPNTIAPDNKNPELHDEEAYVRIFGPRPADWRQDNPAGWFNFATASKNGEVLDEDKVWQEYMDRGSPYDAEAYDGFPPLRRALMEGDTQETKLTPQEEWEEFKNTNPGAYDSWRQDIIHTAKYKKELNDPNVQGPHADIFDHETGALLSSPYGGVIRFPDILDIVNKYSSPDKTETEYWREFPYGSASTKALGRHEATHGITSFLSGVGMNARKLPLGRDGTGYRPEEIPTTIVENLQRDSNKFSPAITGTGALYRDKDDAYLRFIYPTADAARVSMAGQVDPAYQPGWDPYASRSEYPGVDPVGMVESGVRFWNMADPQGKPARITDLRFFPDTPTGLYYDKFGNIRLAGGELADYQRIWGNGKAKDISELPPNLQRNVENMGQAPQAWIDAIDDPEGFAAAQDRVRRELFPLKRKDVIGDLRSGDMFSIDQDLDRHPALELIRSRIPSNIDSMSNDERLDLYNKIADEVETYYPELRFNPEATPDYLVQAQKIFGLDPDMGVTTVRTKKQYDDAAKYIDYYRRLDEYLSQNDYQ